MKTLKQDIFFSLLKDLVQTDCQVILPFSGTSMLPTILPNHDIKLVKIQNLELNKVYVYVDTFSPTKRLVCHRLIKIDNKVAYFKGDNRNQMDWPVPLSMIIAEVALL